MAQYPIGKARPARAPWWSASRDLLARTMDARPAQGTPWWSASGAAPSNSRHNLWLFIGAWPRFPAPSAQLSPVCTYPSRSRGRGQQGLQHFPGREPARRSGYRFRGERLPDSSQTLTRSYSRRKASACPMVVSQWGLDSKSSGCKTSPGHPMVAASGAAPSPSQYFYGSQIGKSTKSSQHPGAQLCSARPHIQVEPGAAVRRVLLVPRKETSEWQQQYSTQTLVRPAALHCHGPSQSGCLERYQEEGVSARFPDFWSAMLTLSAAVDESVTAVLRDNRQACDNSSSSTPHAGMPVGMGSPTCRAMLALAECHIARMAS